jgi:anti-anti-sigma regulatory factor
MTARFNSYELPRWRVVAVSGELDLASAPAFRSAGLIAINKNSANPAIILGFRRRCLKKSGTLHLVVSDERILQVFKLTDTYELFDTWSTLEGALGTDFKS